MHFVLATVGPFRARSQTPAPSIRILTNEELKTMSKAIRIMLVLVALLCVPALIYPELGMTNSPVNPLAVMFVAILAAIVWPSSDRKNRPNRDR